MRKLGITRGVPIVGLENARRSRYDKHPYVEQVDAPADACLLSILDEDYDGANAFHGSLITLFATGTESPTSYYQTGNPFRLRERFTMLVTAGAPRIKSAHLRASPTLAKLGELLGPGPTLTSKTDRPGLRDSAIPQQRWVQARWEVARDAVCDLLRPGDRIQFGSPCRLVKETVGRFIYLNVADDLDDWVKIGKAEESPQERLMKQQLCNARALSHLGVWKIPEDRKLATAETDAKRWLASAGAKGGSGGSEWRRIEWCTALGAITCGAQNSGWTQIY